MKKRKSKHRRADTRNQHDLTGGVRGKYARRQPAASIEALRSLNVLARRRRGKTS